MRVVDDVVEVAMDLYYTNITDDDYKLAYGHDRPTWDEAPEWMRDDYIEQAKRLLEIYRMGKV